MYSSSLRLIAVNVSSTRRLLRKILTVLPCAVASLSILSLARAVSPPPDGGYSNENTAEGDDALHDLTSGTNNTAIGFQTLSSNTTGVTNTASGSGALLSNTIGGFNTANGAEALIINTTGDNNTATGFAALFSNTTGGNNSASGFQALSNNTSGGNNSASGFGALNFNTTGYYNTGDGAFALYHNTIGHDNTGSGNQTLFNNTRGNFNIALGNLAGYNLTTGSNNIDIGNLGVAGDAAKIRIGKSGTHNATYIAGIYGKTVASATKVAVMIDSTGKLGTVVSSARFKEAIKPMDSASEALLALKPVTFRYKHELDPDGIPQFGLVAEEVEKINPDLVVRGEDGKVNTVRYEAVNAMLLNEFLKEHRKVQDLEKQVAALTAGLQKVTAELETRDRVSVVAISQK